MSAASAAVGGGWEASARNWRVAAPLIGAARGIHLVVVAPMLAVALLALAALGTMATWTPVVLLAAYLLIPIYKGLVQPFLPVDLTGLHEERVFLGLVFLVLCAPPPGHVDDPIPLPLAAGA